MHTFYPNLMQRTGFTLIEMLIVAIVFAAMVTMLSPSLVRELGAAKTRAAVNRFRSAHSLTRSTGIRYGRVAEFHIDAATARFWVEVDTSEAGGVTDTVGTIQDIGGGPFVMTSNRTLVCFDGRGLATTAGGCEAGDVTVVFSLAGRSDTVNVSSLGKVLR